MSFPVGLYSRASQAVCAVRAGLYARGWRKPRPAPLPVVSVGNLSLGGSGKTPVVIALAAAAMERGWKPAVVSRGYKGRWERHGGIVSDGTAVLASWREAGDEPALIARRLPGTGVFVGRDRLASCRRASLGGFDLAILDDGFQHLRLARDLDIVLHRPGRNGYLREGFGALRRADLVLCPADPGPEGPFFPPGASPRLGAFSFRIQPESVVDLGSGRPAGLESLRGKRAVAFCGIARPERFFNLLEELGLDIAVRISFPDHFSYPPRALAAISSALGRAGAEAAVTTEKDGVKVEGSPSGAWPFPVYALRLAVELPEEVFQAVDAAAARTEPRLG